MFNNFIDKKEKIGLLNQSVICKRTSTVIDILVIFQINSFEKSDYASRFIHPADVYELLERQEYYIPQKLYEQYFTLFCALLILQLLGSLCCGCTIFSSATTKTRTQHIRVHKDLLYIFNSCTYTRIYIRRLLLVVLYVPLLPKLERNCIYRIFPLATYCHIVVLRMLL